MFAVQDLFVAIGIIALATIAFTAWRFVKELVKGGEYERFTDMVEAAVKFAEQTMQSAEGQEKLAAVMAQLQAAFPKLDVSFIRVFVEGYVNQMSENRDFRATLERKVESDTD